MMPPPTLPERPTVPLAPVRRRGGPGAVLVRLGLALLASVGVVATYVLAVLDPSGRRVDDAVMQAAMARGAGLRDELTTLLDLLAVPTVLLATAVLVGVALLRGRGAQAVSVLVIVLGSQVVTQVLKAALPRVGDAAGNSLPSGHVTLVVALGVALVLVAPAVWRGLAGVLALGAGAVAGVATMVAGWHRPSDLVASVGVVLAVTALSARA